MRTLLFVLGVAALGCSSAPPPTTSPDAAPSAAPAAGSAHPRETFSTSQGPVVVTAIHHASTLFEFAGKTIYVDPWSEGNLADLPKADFILISDIHPDHLDPKAIDALKKADTVLVGPAAVGEKQKLGITIANGETKDVGPVKVEGVAMYNLVRGPEAGKFFHDKGRGDGFVITFGDKRVYLSGDTECTPEMKALKNIDVAFVCMNLPYTMPPSEAAACIKAFKPKVLIPYHYKGQNPDELKESLKGEPIEMKRLDYYR